MSLTVTSATGAATETQVDYVTVTELPSADFRPSTSGGTPPLEVSFEDMSTGNPLAPVTSWSWDFGDGTTSTEQSPTHVYSSEGVYQVTLAVTSEHGFSAPVTSTINVAPAFTLDQRFTPTGAVQLANGEMAIAGTVSADHTNGNAMYLTHLDATGEERWAAVFDRPFADRGDAVASATNSDIILAGTSGTNYIIDVGGGRQVFGPGDIYIARVSPAGDNVWVRAFETLRHEDVVSVISTSEDRILVVGSTFWDSFSGQYALMLDSQGSEIWFETFLLSSVYDVAEIANLGFVLLGAQNENLVLLAIDESGNELWTRPISGGIGRRIAGTQDGEVVLAANADNGKAINLTKASAGGDEIWSRSFQDFDALDATSLLVLSDGGIVVAGTAHTFARGTDFFLLKTDDEGNEEWRMTYGGSLDESCVGLTKTPGGGFVLVGTSHSFGPWSPSVFIVRTDGEGNELVFP